MTVHCPLCGAQYPGDERCEDRFNRFLALELEDPAYGVVHHLTVPAYLLQHNAYSRAGWLLSRDLLARFVREEFDPAIARRLHRQDVDSGNRDWSVTRGPKPEWIDEITWTRTIADVRADDPGDYRAGIRAWAESVLADTETIVADRDLPGRP
jgi:hypothetical protein